MPVFKYSQASEVNTGRLSLPRLAATGSMAAEGDVSLFALGVSGAINNGISGDLSLPLAAISGLADLDAVKIPPLVVSGWMKADGEVSFQKLGISGVVQAYSRVAIPALSIDGEMLVGSAIDGDISLRKLSIDGLGAQGGTLSLRRLNVSGVVIGGNEIFGDITFRYDFGGTVFVGSALNGSIPLPGAEVDGDVLVGAAIDGDFSFPPNAVSGDVSVTPTISGEIALAWPMITGQALIPAGASGDVSLRCVAVDGQVDITAFADCSFSRPKISISGSLSIPVVYSSDGVVKLGIIAVSGTAFSSSVQSSSEDEVLHYDISRRLI